MNRNIEYTKLMEQLEETPLKLDYTLDRARARRAAEIRRHRAKRAVFAPLGTLAAVFAVFVLLVNISPTFAYAAGRIPLISDLAKLVAYSPSLTAAVENEYVQPIEQEQTVNGITARVEYVIVDQKQLNVYFSLDSDTYFAMDASPDVLGADGKRLDSCSICSGGLDIPNGDLRELTLDFVDKDMPDFLTLRLKVHDNGSYVREEPVQSVEEDMLSGNVDKTPDAIAEFNFNLSLDPYYTAQGETIPVNQSFDLDGQKFTLTKAEIYPTHMRFTFDDTPENTAWLKSLEFYVENEKGERFESIANGISASGRADSPMMETYMLESAFFSESEHLALKITGVTWLDKDMETIRVDLENETADKLPDGVKLEQAVKKKNGWIVYFSAPELEENHHYQLFGWSYYDKQGKEYSINSSSSTGGGYYDDSSNTAVSLPGRFVEYFPLKDFADSEVRLSPSFSSRVSLDEPISIEIK